MSLASQIGGLVYRGIEFMAMNVVATHKVTVTFDYRRRWSRFLPPHPPAEPSLWIHGASVGELEDLAAFYGNEQLLAQAGYKSSQLVLTSSSASAEDFLVKMKKRLGALYAGPIPPDVNPRVREFFERLRPELLILSQSDTWPVLMSLANQRLEKGAIWLPHKDSSASWSRRWLLAPTVKIVGLRREESVNPLPGSESVFIGSPRVDRILERVEGAKSDHPLQSAMRDAGEKIKIMIGSAWKEDALIVRAALDGLPPEVQRQFAVFAIPHDPRNAAEISAISVYTGKHVILEEGILLESYRDFDIAFVGGAFRTGLHNIVEPLAWGIPTLCGTDTRKQPEAPYYEEQGALKTVEDSDELRDLLLSFAQKAEAARDWQQRAREAREILRSQRGASTRLAALVQTLHIRK